MEKVYLVYKKSENGLRLYGVFKPRKAKQYEKRGYEVKEFTLNTPSRKIIKL